MGASNWLVLASSRWMGCFLRRKDLLAVIGSLSCRSSIRPMPFHVSVTAVAALVTIRSSQLQLPLLHMERTLSRVGTPAGILLTAFAKMGTTGKRSFAMVVLLAVLCSLGRS